jgi:heme oxygenase
MISTIIKEATLAAHQQLEKKVILKLKAIRSDADYAALLTHFYNYFSGLEKVIAPYITTDVLPDYGKRRNTARLEADIRELGAHMAELPAIAFPAVNDALEAMAVLYVMEGSVLGGRIIVEMLAKSSIIRGISFFSGYGAATGLMWKTFLAALDDRGSNEADVDRAVQKANETFLRFSEAF